MIKSWKTTVCAGLVCAGYFGDKLQRHVVCPGWVSWVAAGLFIAGMIGIGLFARDHDKTSEDHGLHEV